MVQQSQLSSSGFVEVVVYLNVYIYIYYVYYKYIKLKLQIHQQGGQGHAFRTGAIGTSLYSGGV